MSGIFFLMYTNTAATTRFGGDENSPEVNGIAHQNIVGIRSNGSNGYVLVDNIQQNKVDDSPHANNIIDFQSTDCIVAAVEASATTGGITRIQSFLQGATGSRTVKGKLFFSDATVVGTATGGSSTTLADTSIAQDLSVFHKGGNYRLLNTTDGTSGIITGSSNADTLTAGINFDAGEGYIIRPEPDIGTVATYDFKSVDSPGDAAFGNLLDSPIGFGWSTEPPEVQVNKSYERYWEVDFSATETGITGSGPVKFGTPVASIRFGVNIQSDNYVTGTSGWQIKRDSGDAEFNNVTARGSIKGGKDGPRDYINYNSPLDSPLPHSETSTTLNTGFYLGPDDSPAGSGSFDFIIGDSTNQLRFDGSSGELDIRGAELSVGSGQRTVKIGNNNIGIGDNFVLRYLDSPEDEAKHEIIMSSGAVEIGTPAAHKNVIVTPGEVRNFYISSASATYFANRISSVVDGTANTLGISIDSYGTLGANQGIKLNHNSLGYYEGLLATVSGTLKWSIGDSSVGATNAKVAGGLQITGPLIDSSGDTGTSTTGYVPTSTGSGWEWAAQTGSGTVSSATNSSHVLVTDNESTNEENLITFVEDATSATGNVGLEMDGNFSYNPSTGTVSATIFKGNIDAVDGDFDGTLEADAITIGGTAVGSIFSPIAGGGNIVTTGALNSGSITSGFGAIDNGSSAITTTGVGSFGSLDISGAIDVDGTTNLDAVDIDGAVDMASTLTVADDANFDSGTLFVDASANNVGIGTTSPADKLHVAGNAKVTGTIIIPNIKSGVADGPLLLSGGNSGGANIELYGESGTYANDTFYDANMHTIRNAAGSTTIAEFDSSEVDIKNRLKVDVPSDAWTTSTAWYSVSDGASNEYGSLTTGGSYAVTLNGNGYRGSSGWTSHGANSNTGATQIWQYPAGYITLNANTSWATTTDGSNKVVTENTRFFGNGQVGIGTSAIAATEASTGTLLAIDGGISLEAGDGRGLKFWDNNSNSYGLWMSAQGNSTYGGRLDSTSDYNLYFNMSSGTNRGFVFKNGGTAKAQIDGGGNIFAVGDVTAFVSDERLKTRVDTIDNAVEKVCSLSGFIYKFNDTAKDLGYDTEKRQVGLSAQEVEKVLPEVIKPAPVDNKYKTLDYAKVVPLLVEAIKEQQEQIENLQKKLEEMSK